MKRVAAILVLFCMVIYLGGYQLVAMGYRWEQKAAMKTWLRTNRQSPYHTVFSFATSNGQISDPELHWEETGKEFSYKGSLYDIISVELQGSRATVYCVNDHAEKQLLTVISGMHERQQKSSAGAKTGFQKLLLSVFEIQQTPVNTATAVLTQKILPRQLSKPVSRVRDILSPPPEVV
ncbi:MAG: hypothetical protein HYU71_00270 [Bacteroidetes bacterium]|nr:hypothetical protein [Bacteroidota bacterium]